MTEVKVYFDEKHPVIALLDIEGSRNELHSLFFISTADWSKVILDLFTPFMEHANYLQKKELVDKIKEIVRK